MSTKPLRHYKCLIIHCVVRLRFNRIGRKKTLALLMSVAGVSCFAILFIDLAGKYINIARILCLCVFM